MLSLKNFRRYYLWFATVCLQLIMTQVVTFVATLPFPDTENFPQNHPLLFVFILGITFSTGVFLAGWLALRRHWLPAEPRYARRLAGSLVGAYVPLIVAVTVYHPLEAGNPFFFVSIVSCILGYHISTVIP